MTPDDEEVATPTPATGDLPAPHMASKWKWKQLASAFFCPCLLLGHLKSVTARESKAEPFLCFEYKLGRQGKEVCMQTACLTALCWPCPLGVSAYLLRQRHHIRVMYYAAISNTITLSDIGSACCLWPCMILQHIDFIDRKFKDGSMLFDWEADPTVLRDKYTEPPPHTAVKVLVVGPPRSGKSMFAHKLLRATNVHAPVEANPLQVGFRPLQVTRSNITFLEVWDCPNVGVTDFQISKLLENTQSIAAIFNAFEMNSLEITMSIIGNIKGQLKPGCRIVVIATNVDRLWELRPKEQTVTSSPSFVEEIKRMSSALHAYLGQIQRAKEWAASMNCAFVEVASSHNYHILEAGNLLTNLDESASK